MGGRKGQSVRDVPKRVVDIMQAATGDVDITEIERVAAVAARPIPPMNTPPTGYATPGTDYTEALPAIATRKEIERELTYLGRSCADPYARIAAYRELNRMQPGNLAPTRTDNRSVVVSVTGDQIADILFKYRTNKPLKAGSPAPEGQVIACTDAPDSQSTPE